MLRLPPGIPLPKRTRAPRPNQLPPSARNNASKRTRNGINSNQEDRPPKEEGDDSEHRKKMAKQAQEWDERRAENVKQYQMYSEDMAKLRAQEIEATRKLYQKQVDVAAVTVRKDHPCCASYSYMESETDSNTDGGTAIDENTSPLNLVRTRSVVVIGAGYRFVLHVPMYRCGTCQKIVTVHPYVVACASTTATENCETWIQQSALHAFRDAHLNNGFSAGAQIKVWENVERWIFPLGIELVDANGKKFTATLKPEQLITASVQLGNVEMETTAIGLISSDPFMHCYVCAMSSKGTLEKHGHCGVVVPPVKLSVCTDAMNSSNRFAAAGRSQQGIAPGSSTFLGSLALKVLADYRDGTLVNKAKERAEAAQRSTDEAGVASVVGACTTALSCNREATSHTRGEMAFFGMVCVVCAHVFPGLNLCIPMPTPEQHMFYDYVLGEAIRSRPDLVAIYLDLMCRYHKRFRALADDLIRQDVVAPEAREIALLIPWMHAFDHDLACQLQFSALYRHGAGRRVGEQTEAWWSLLKPLAKIARYMSEAHWFDSYNQLCWELTRRKQRGFPVMMQRRVERIDKKLVSCRSEMQSLGAEALAHGVDSLQAALEFLESGESGPVVTLGLGGQLVEVLIKLRSLDGLILHKAAYPILLPNNTGIHLHEKGNNEGDRKKLVMLRNQLLKDLKVELGEVWTEDSQEYKDALEELREYVLGRYRALIEDQVFKRKMMLQEAQQVESGKNAAKDGKRLLSNRTNIKNFLQVYHTWKVFGTDRDRENVTEKLVSDVCRGAFPWREEVLGNNGSESAQRHYGLRYRSATNQLKRTEEEQLILKEEIVRLFNRLEELTTLVQDRIIAQETIAQRCRDEVETDEGEIAEAISARRLKLRLARGKAHLLGRELARLQGVSEEAEERLSRLLPAPPLLSSI